MSVIGPRPQLVRDMVFMTPEQRRRHTAKPGLSGLAQVNGRNAISWEDKIEWDLKYIEKVSLDVVNNVWLFIPFGTGLYAIFRKKRVWIAALALSVTIELMYLMIL